MNILTFEDFLVENYTGIRKKHEKIDLSQVKWAFHWINEGNLFEQMYDTKNVNTTPFVLRKNNNKKLEMPQLPPEKFTLGHAVHGQVCMTIDPGYYNAGFTGESNICLVFSMESLKDLKMQDLTGNGEAEIRFNEIPNWNKRVYTIYTTNKVWNKGDGWEGFFYRAVSEWFSPELKPIVQILSSPQAISKALEKL